MTDNSVKVTDLPVANSVRSTDRVLVLRDPTGNASLRTTTIATLGANLVLSKNAPASQYSNGVAGTIAYSNTHFYVCIANNTWVRTALSSW